MNTLTDEGKYLKENDAKLSYNDIKNNSNVNTIKIQNGNNNYSNLIENKTSDNNNDSFLSINEKEEILPPKIIDKIICGSRRRKFPRGIRHMGGYFFTVFLFLFFSTVLTLCIKYTKQSSLILSDSTIIYFTVMQIIVWITTIIALISHLDAATSDPGRQRGSTISKKKYLNSKIKSVINGKKLVLKYCDTCKLIRDVRSFHCKECGLCVERHDHHCGYLSNCVGIGNYHKFYFFVLISFIHVFNILCFCCYFLNVYNEQKSKASVWILLGMVVVTIYGGVFSIYLLTLFADHTKNVIKNQLIRELIKKKGHPEFDRGYKKNCREALRNKFPIYDIHSYF